MSAQNNDIPNLMTVPCMIYHAERINLLMFSAISTHFLPRQADDFMRQMATNFPDDQILPEMAETVKFHRKHGLGAERMMRVYERMAFEMYLVRSVSDFLAYLSNILVLVYKARPEILSPMQVTIKDVLEYGTTDALIEATAERKIEEVSNKGMNGLQTYFCQTLQVTLFKDDDALQKADYLRAVRNLIVHKRGMVDRKFLADVPSRRGKDVIDQKVILDDVLPMMELLHQVVNNVEEALATKYGLDRTFTQQHFWTFMRHMVSSMTDEETEGEAEGEAS